jgi:hypothetical protein
MAPLMSELRKCTKWATAEQPHMGKGKIIRPMIGILEINTAPGPTSKLGMTWLATCIVNSRNQPRYTFSSGEM